MWPSRALGQRPRRLPPVSRRGLRRQLAGGRPPPHAFADQGRVSGSTRRLQQSFTSAPPTLVRDPSAPHIRRHPMRILPTATTVAVLAMAAATLGACGSDDEKKADTPSDYCQELKSDKVYFQSLNGSDPDLSKLDTLFEKMHSLAAAAPSDIAAGRKT